MRANQGSPETATTPGRRFYEPELDALRFFAFLAVFYVHSAPSGYAQLGRYGSLLPGLLLAVRNASAFGLCMFFLLSSYLITKLLSLEQAATGSIHLKSFYVRRVLRIWPLYLGFVALMWLLGRYQVFDPVETGQLLAFLLFAGNFYTARHGFSYNPIMPLWSISIEEQFYFVWPTLAKFGMRPLKWAAWVVLAAAVPAAWWIHRSSGDVPREMFTSSFVEFQFFALGALLALKFPSAGPRYSLGSRLGLLALGCAALLVASGPLHINDSGQTPLPWPLLSLGYEIMALGIVLIFLSVLGIDGRFVPNSLRYLGKISFGLYVFHFMSLRVCQNISKHYGMPTGFRFFGAALMTLALAALSYQFFEKPFLKLKSRFTFVKSRTA
jgi:peptidoglycan/LPS O-acetylase OafA/YrhL